MDAYKAALDSIRKENNQEKNTNNAKNKNENTRKNIKAPIIERLSYKLHSIYK